MQQKQLTEKEVNASEVVSKLIEESASRCIKINHTLAENQYLKHYIKYFCIQVAPANGTIDKDLEDNFI